MAALPSTKGWGPGWPNCQRDKITPHDLYVGGIRDELVELVDLLTAECRRRGFEFMRPGCWGFGCRCVKTSSGAQECGPGDTPSFHSWGLAVDINAPRNVFGAPRSSSEIATKFPWLPRLFAEYTFEWLGPINGDWMHFGFVGSPADAKAATEAARRELGGDDDDVRLEDYYFGFDEYIERRKEKGEDPGPPPDQMENPDKRKGWNHARFASNWPKPGA